MLAVKYHYRLPVSLQTPGLKLLNTVSFVCSFPHSSLQVESLIKYSPGILNNSISNHHMPGIELAKSVYYYKKSVWVTLTK